VRTSSQNWVKSRGEAAADAGEAVEEGGCSGERRGAATAALPLMVMGASEQTDEDDTAANAISEAAALGTALGARLGITLALTLALGTAPNAMPGTAPIATPGTAPIAAPGTAPNATSAIAATASSAS